MLVLLDAADVDDAVIPEKFTPSLTDIVSRTGLGRGTVADRLNDLEQGGWVKRDRPTTAAARAGAKTRYAMTIGDAAAGLKEKKEPTAKAALSSPGAGLVREEDQSGSRTSPGAGLALVREPDLASPGAGRGVVREPDGKDTYQLPTTSYQYQPARQADADEPTLPIAVDEKSKAKKAAKPKRDLYDDPGFVEFWAAYPRKDDKKKAWAAWESAIKDADPADIVAGCKRYRDDPNRDPGYTKLPTSWLNAGAWDNGPLPPRGGSNGHQPYRNPDPADYHGEL